MLKVVEQDVRFVDMKFNDTICGYSFTAGGEKTMMKGKRN
jgi:hypothetical protein